MTDQRASDSTQKYIGLHAPVWVPVEDLVKWREEIKRMTLRVQLGDRVSALELLALEVLKVNAEPINKLFADLPSKRS